MTGCMGTLSCGWRAALVTWATLTVCVGVAIFVGVQFDSEFEATGVGKVVVGGLYSLMAMIVFSPVALALAGLVGFTAGRVDRRRNATPISS